MTWDNPMTKPAFLSAWEATNRAAGNRFLGALEDDSLALLQLDLRQLTLPQGAVCYGAGDPIDQVYFPLTGMIALVIVADGEMVEISSVGREGAVGLQSAFGPRLSFTRATVQLPGKFWAISALRFEHASSRSVALRDMVIRYIEIMWAQAQQNAACNAVHDSSSRLCRWLLQCVDRTGSDQLLLTQDCLAAMLGVRRTTVTLLAQQLQNRGIVRYSRGRITILDRSALQANACACYDAISDKDHSSKIDN
ncbi:MAG: Crp/Fnr family transcriptional regulator [Xanthobacteraceae bacterium]